MASIPVPIFLLLGLSCRTRPKDADDAWTVVAKGLDSALLTVSGDQDRVTVGASHAEGATPSALELMDGAWADAALTAAEDIWWIHGADDTQWAAGDGHVYKRIEFPGGWHGYRPTTSADVTWFGVWGQSNDLWAAGASLDDGRARLAHYSDGTWVMSDLPESISNVFALYKVWGRDADDVWAVGADGTALHWDGAEWSVVPTPTTEPLFTIAGDDERLFAVGGLSQAVLLSWDGDQWTDVTPSGVSRLSGVAVREGCDAVAAGSRGAVFVERDHGWSLDPRPMPASDSDFHAVWLDAQCAAWVVGGHITSWPMTDGVLLYGGTQIVPEIDGSDFSRDDPPTEPKDTGDPSEPEFIEEIVFTCEGDVWTFEAEVTHWAPYRIELALLVDATTEVHIAELLKMHPQGYWYRYGLTLSAPTTAVGCDMQSEVTGAITVYGSPDNIADCGAWGAQPELFEDCRDVSGLLKQ